MPELWGLHIENISILLQFALVLEETKDDTILPVPTNVTLQRIMFTDQLRAMFCTILQFEKYFTPQIDSLEWMVRYYIQNVQAIYLSFMELNIRKIITLKKPSTYFLVFSLYIELLLPVNHVKKEIQQDKHKFG